MDDGPWWRDGDIRGDVSTAAVTGLLGLFTSWVAPLFFEDWIKEHRIWMAGSSAVLFLAALIFAGRAASRRRRIAAANRLEWEQRRLAQDEADLRTWEARARAALVWWPPPTIEEASRTPELLGVHPARGMPGPLTAYVPRDLDRHIAESLRARGRLLIVGAPGSGLTRTALELALRQCPGLRVLAPVSAHGLSVALDELLVLDAVPGGGPVLLWLDQVDRFATAVTADQLTTLTRRAGSKVVATIQSHCLEGFLTAANVAASQLDQTRSLTRRPSQVEITQAGQVHPGLDVSEGIAAAFTGLDALLRKVAASFPVCSFEPEGAHACPIAARLVAVAADWIGTGTTRPLTVDLVRSLLGCGPDHLAIGALQGEEHLEAVLDWGRRAVKEGRVLFTASGEELRLADDVAADLLASAGAPDEMVWRAAVDDAHTGGDDDAVGRIGYQAHLHRFYPVETYAWDHIPSIDSPGMGWLNRALADGESAHSSRAQLPGLTRLLELTQERYGLDHLEVAAALSTLGAAWAEVGQPTKARELFERALTIRQRECGPDHPKVAAALSNLGTAWGELGQPTKARELFERALSIEERESGPDHPKVVAALSNLGIAWRELGQPAKALELFERALTIEEREYGPDHPQVAGTLGSLGAVWRELGEPARARELLERALTIEEREYGPNHPQVAGTLGSLGAVWSELGHPAKARELLERALTIREREYGPDHPQVASALINLGIAFRELGHPAKARELLERALTIREREYGPDHPQVATALTNLGAAWSELGHPAKARDLFERALFIEEREYGPDHAKVAAALGNLAVAWGKLGQPTKVRQLLERALTIFRSSLPAGHPWIALTERQLRQFAPDVIPLSEGVARSSGVTPTE